MKIRKSIFRIIKEVCKKIKNHVIINGKNFVVEIKEPKFGKRKYNRGHKVDGVCVVERTPKEKLIYYKCKICKIRYTQYKNTTFSKNKWAQKTYFKVIFYKITLYR